MSRTATRRAPTRNGGFSWGCFPMGDTGIVAYRLFRRDQSGTVHFQGFTAQPYHTRAEIAVGLRAACHSLRDHVDEIDLVAMEIPG